MGFSHRRFLFLLVLLRCGLVLREGRTAYYFSPLRIIIVRLVRPFQCKFSGDMPGVGFNVTSRCEGWGSVKKRRHNVRREVKNSFERGGLNYEKPLSVSRIADGSRISVRGRGLLFEGRQCVTSYLTLHNPIILLPVLTSVQVHCSLDRWHRCHLQHHHLQQMALLSPQKFPAISLLCMGGQHYFHLLASWPEDQGFTILGQFVQRL